MILNKINTTYGDKEVIVKELKNLQKKDLDSIRAAMWHEDTTILKTLIEDLRIPNLIISYENK
jgi:hypothetical protein